MSEPIPLSKFVDRAVSELLKQKRWPAGSPGSKGGQFAPSSGAKGGGQKSFPFKQGGFSSGGMGSNWKPWGGLMSPDPWPGEDGKVPYEKPLPKGAKAHPQAGDKGETIMVHYPSKPSDKGTWKDGNATATFVPGGDAPAVLNGVPMKAWAGAPKTKAEWANVPGQNPALEEGNPFRQHETKYTAAGVLIREPDGRIWLTEPTNRFGGYKATFPKGTAEPELSLQANAIKEAYEETGLQVRITGILGDFEKTTSYARFYVAERVGGTPSDMGWESQSLKLAPMKEARRLLNVKFDQDILDELEFTDLLKKKGGRLSAFSRLAKAAKGAAKPSGKHYEKQPRWPAGTPLGGQWKSMGAGGFTLPPVIAGGMEGKNASYQKKAAAIYDMANKGDAKGIFNAAVALKQKVDKDAAAGKKSSHVKWTAQLSQYASHVSSEITGKAKEPPAAIKAAAAAKPSGGSKSAPPSAVMSAYEKNNVPTLSSFGKKTGHKPGGSNPGGMYHVASPTGGSDVLVKGNKQLAEGKQTQAVSNDRARNEVLASKLMQAVGVGAPNMGLVDLEGQYGGGLGVASVMVKGGQAFDVSNKAHVAAAQADFATHAWLGNWDVMGIGYDNTIIVDGKAVNIDPGGAILFRAQGMKKNSFDSDASDFDTMRKGTNEQKAVYGSMTPLQLKESAKALALIPDADIIEMVKTHGPKETVSNLELANTLIGRKHAILAKVGLNPDGSEKAAPEPPKVKEALKSAGIKPDSPAGILGVELPTFNAGLGDKVYASEAQKALDAFNDGNSAALDDIYYGKMSQGSSANAKKLNDFVGNLSMTLQMGLNDEELNLWTGAKGITDSNGATWTGGSDGVLNPIKATALHADYFGSVASGFNLTNKGDQNKLIDLKVAAMSGDATALAAVKMPGSAGKLLQKALYKAMTGDELLLFDTSKPAKPQVRTITAAQKPAEPPKGSNPAMQKMVQDALLPESNKNAKSHNPKMELLGKLYSDGDVKGILALNYGSNNYALKQVDTANAMLADLGSPHKVEKSQKKNSHPAIIGGSGQPSSTITPSPAPKVAVDQKVHSAGDLSWVKLGKGEEIIESKRQFGITSVVIKVPAKGFDPASIAKPPDFFKNGSQGPDGHWKSSKEGVNKANNDAVAEIYQLATSGASIKALSELKLPIVDDAGNVVKRVPVLEHKAAVVKEYFSDVLAELKAQTEPTFKTQQSGSLSGKYSDAIASLGQPFKAKSYSEFKAHAQKAADYLVLSHDAASGVPVPPKEAFSETGPSNKSYASFKKDTHAAVDALSSAERSAINSYTGSSYDTWNYQLRMGDYDSMSAGGKNMVKAFKKAAREIPEGSIIWRGIDVGLSTYQSVIGGIIQDGSFNSASYGAYPHFSHKQTWLRIHAGKGVKAIDATAVSKFKSGEREIIVQNNVRYMVLKAEAHSNFIDSSGKSWGKKNIVDVIALPHED